MPAPTEPKAPTHDPDPRAVKLMVAIREARVERMSQVELAEKLGVRQGYVSRWETTRPPRPADVERIEKVLGLPGGTLMRRAGYVSEGEISVEAAILADDSLTPDYQQIVLNTYRMAVLNSAEARGVRARKADIGRRQPKRTGAGTNVKSRSSASK